MRGESLVPAATIFLHCRYTQLYCHSAAELKQELKAQEQCPATANIFPIILVSYGVNRFGSTRRMVHCQVYQVGPRPLFFMLFPTVCRLCIVVPFDPVWCHRWYQVHPAESWYQWYHCTCLTSLVPFFDAGISHFGTSGTTYPCSGAKNGTTGIKIWHQPAGVAPLVLVV